MDRKTEQIYRQRLLDQRADLLDEETASKETRAAVELDQSRVGRLSRMDAMQGQAMANAIAQRRQTALRKIDAALARLDEGEFGYCVHCGEDIAPKRLNIDPASPRCSSCA